MSSWSEAEDCPMCGSEGSLETCTENRPILSSSGICLKCGYSYKTVEEQMTLGDVNDERANCEMEPLTELKPSTFKEDSKE